MSTTPFMKLWVPDFLADLQELDAQEIGAYMLILMSMWQKGGTLPNDERKLKKIARVSRNWPRVWSAISHYFNVDANTISNSRLTKELEDARAKSAANSKNGARGGRAKALKDIETKLANASVSSCQPEPELEPKPELTTVEPSSNCSKREYSETENTAAAQPPEAEILEFRELILEAMGHPTAMGTMTPDGRIFGTFREMTEAKKWITDLGLTKAEVLGVIRDIRARGGPPIKSITYFTGAMQDYAAAKSKTLAPTQQTGENHVLPITDRNHSSPCGPANRPDPATEQILRIVGLRKTSGDGSV